MKWNYALKMMSPEPDDNNHVEPSTEEVLLAKIQDLETQLTNAVSKEEYDKVEKEKNMYLTQYLNKRQPPKQGEEEKHAVDYAKKFQTAEPMTNREFIKNALAYRNAFIKESGRDPWSDKGEETPETKKTAAFLQAALDETDSDFAFRSLINEHLKDDPMLVSIVNARAKDARKNKRR